jgi:FlaA1/EpsC-like NDP-sugar epimerase
MSSLFRIARRGLLLGGDCLAVVLANLMAVALRFDFDMSQLWVREQRIFELVLLDLVVTPLTFYLTGLYQSYWKYAGLNDLVRLVRSVALRAVTLVVLLYALELDTLSRAVLIIASVLLLALCGSFRLVPRFQFEIQSSLGRTAGRRTLIIGAGDTGESLLRELRKNPASDFNPVGFIDDDREKLGVKIHGIPVLGDRTALRQKIESLGVRDVIIAVPGVSRDAMREIFEICRETGSRFRTVPTRGELERGAARVSQIRLVDLDDLLGRDVVRLDLQPLRQSLSRRRILVTGAAGSIGRELARQIAGYEPEELILLDRNENSLFHLDAELRESHPLLAYRVVVGDVQDPQRLEALFAAAHIHVVFHAAAYKHVPLMEDNPLEAIKNNVAATRRLAEAASRHGVERFIYISTDKAVRPTSVMGATKRLGERLVKSLPGNTTRFMAVRFGNVLGSDGSVVPTFRRQIAAGGPVTVTHPEATRYFMTIPEAVHLVLVAGTLGEGGEIFLLRMGEPVRILDLARNLIELSGLRPDVDVKIGFTGLRPGEKLNEELQNDAEHTLPTSNEKIMILSGVERLSPSAWQELDTLERVAQAGESAAALALLCSLVPDYQSMTAGQRREDAVPKIVSLDSKRRADVQG